MSKYKNVSMFLGICREPYRIESRRENYPDWVNDIANGFTFGWEDEAMAQDDRNSLDAILSRRYQCDHVFERRKRRIGKYWRTVEQCLHCTDILWDGVKRDPRIDDLPEAVVDDSYRINQAINEISHEILYEWDLRASLEIDIEKQQQQEDAIKAAEEWDAAEKIKYEEYLKSPEWRVLREAVIKRCRNVCEGCGRRSVQEIHHMSYAHKYNEFLVELVGFCHNCHSRWHGK